MMVLHGTLVSDPENWCTYQSNGLFFPVVHFIHVFDQTLAEQLYRDKGIFSGLSQGCKRLFMTHT